MLLFWIIFALVVASVAGNYGRSSVGWFFLALLISPLLAIIFLLIAGKTEFRKAQEMVIAQHLAGAGQPLPLALALPAPARTRHSGVTNMAAPLIIVLLPFALLALLFACLSGSSHGEEARSAAFVAAQATDTTQDALAR